MVVGRPSCWARCDKKAQTSPAKAAYASQVIVVVDKSVFFEGLWLRAMCPRLMCFYRDGLRDVVIRRKLIKAGRAAANRVVNV